ncbi:MAG: hypothetical protein KAH38_05285, partial [Candidatus Hydrogenedentes bacterium]|nr:hypothetical protein [Candidatus Hydrogenedentota bacterium]
PKNRNDVGVLRYPPSPSPIRHCERRTRFAGDMMKKREKHFLSERSAAISYSVKPLCPPELPHTQGRKLILQK